MPRVRGRRVNRAAASAAVFAIALGSAGAAWESSAPQEGRAPTGVSDSAAVQGRALFLRYNCYGCHGGLAGGAMGPSLRDTVWESGGTDADIYESIAEGHPEMGMPPWKKKMSGAQIRQIVAYIRSLRTSAEPTFFWGADSAAAAARRP